MSPYPVRRALALLLLGLGIFQLLASIAALFFWLIAGEWQPYVPLIAVFAFLVTWPLALGIRNRLWRH
ncbi:MAG: hypothetical protein KKA73_14020 [Chloroflexi bacterium]|nr:hypothetical protein [Chloroflexota bacterium]MBU1748801.1 hypothetical protein [Chloroflexota bacterium]